MARLVFLTLALACSMLVASQQCVAQPCDPPPCGSPWVAGPGSPLTFTLASGCVVTVTYEVRNCPGQPDEYRVVNRVVVPGPFGSNCDILSDGALSQLVDLQILTNSFAATIPNCDGVNSNSKLVKIYQASCFYEKKCTLEFDDDPLITCDPAGSSLPPWITDIRKIEVSEHIPCGVTCCSRTYELCRAVNPEANPQAYIRIRKLPAVQLTPCDNPPSGGTKPCISQCD